MASPVTFDIPHSLTKDEVRRRFEAGIPHLPVPGGGTVEATWPEPYRADMSIKTFGQTLNVELAVQEAAVEVQVFVPAVLVPMSDAVTGFVRQGVEQMLTGPHVQAAQPLEQSAPSQELQAASGEIPAEARRVHDAAIIVDAVCPLSSDGDHLDRYRNGGVTVVTPTIAAGGDTAVTTFKKLAFWQNLLKSRPELLEIRTAADIRTAKESGRLGILLAFQGADAIEDDLELIDAYKQSGVGIIQLTYNRPNLLGSGCEVANDEGLTEFGRKAVARMNEARVIVDCSHTGYRTTLDAIAASSAPVIFTHANPYAVHPIRRNIKDEHIKAAAATGGVIGVAGYPPFVSNKTKSSLDDLIAHITHIAELVGVDHVGLGLDYFTGQDGIMPIAQAMATYDFLIKAGVWSADNYSPPPYFYPEGIETPDKLGNLTAGLLKRGFSEVDVTKILGGNWLRVFEVVWGA
ncbi:dipeptidase [Burkholderia arboris]|uniref:dipeptidase n=1 Tax=Burkholderia arboris TaxID=488730 RepID=UPI001CF453B5|nr:dipeptidase [Burkholderia arboris]MCA8052362.1 dipeptidase [Burkholderia arboris]